jgi:hypothetical protein
MLKCYREKGITIMNSLDVVAALSDTAALTWLQDLP